MQTEDRFVRKLIFSFPSLHRTAPGLTPWNPTMWAKWWRTSGAQTSGTYHAVALCLSVWSGGNRDAAGRKWFTGYEFDAARAMGSWDNAHRAAFLKWVADPWWP